MKRKLSVLAIVVILSLGLAACGPTPPVPTDTPTPVPPTDTPVPPTDTPVPPTDTPVPPTDTPVPPTDTPVPTNTPTPTDTPMPSVGAAVMARSLNADYEPVETTNVFDPTDIFYCSVKVTDLEEGSEVTAKWFFGSEFLGEYTYTAEDGGSGYIGFNLSPAGTWLAGSYRVDIYLNGELAQSAAFSVVGVEAPPATPVVEVPTLPPLPPISEEQAVDMVEAAVEAAVDPLWLSASFDTKEGYRWLFVSYISHLDPQSQAEEFDSELRQAVFAMVEGFVRADSTPTLTMVMAWAADHVPGSGDPPSVVIVFERSLALSWYNGQIGDEDFIASWTWMAGD